MKRLTTLMGKNLPRLSVGKPGWPVTYTLVCASGPGTMVPVLDPKDLPPRAVYDFTRVCDQTGLSERLRKD